MPRHMIIQIKSFTFYLSLKVSCENTLPADYGYAHGPAGFVFAVITVSYLAGWAERSGLQISKQEQNWEILKTTVKQSFSTQSLIYYCNECCILQQEGRKITGRIPKRIGQTCSQRELEKESLCKLISFDWKIAFSSPCIMWFACCSEKSLDEVVNWLCYVLCYRCKVWNPT